MWSAITPASALPHFFISNLTHISCNEWNWLQGLSRRSPSAPLTSKQPLGWERGQNTAAAHTVTLSSHLCARPHSAHYSDPSQWQCVQAAGPSVTRAVVCLSGLVIEHTSLYTERHELCPDTHTYTATTHTQGLNRNMTHLSWFQPGNCISLYLLYWTFWKEIFSEILFSSHSFS